MFVEVFLKFIDCAGVVIIFNVFPYQVGFFLFGGLAGQTLTGFDLILLFLLHVIILFYINETFCFNVDKKSDHHS